MTRAQLLRRTARAMVAILLQLTCLTGAAQLGTGTVNGTVTDSSGGGIPNAHLTVVNKGTNATRSLTANAGGHYSVPELAVGTYSLRASAPGFGIVSKDNVEVSVGAQLTVDFPLTVGETSTTVNVEASAEGEVNSTSGEQSTLIDPKQIRDLPLNGRNFEQLILLAPGAAPAPGAASNATYGRSASYSISGARPEGGLVLLDGADTEGYWDRGTGASIIGTSLGIEAIAEFQTLTGIYGAQYGGNGSVINAVTRSGTNDIHGSVYDFVRNSVFDARNYFDPLTGPPSFRRNQFGASVGLPLRKDRTFLFVNYEGLRQQLGRSYTPVVPDAQAHQGCVPSAGAPATPNCASGYTYVGVSATVAAYLNFFPLPNLPNASPGSGVGSYRFVADNPANEDYVNTRVDEVLSQKNTLSARYLSDNGSLIDPVPGNLLPGFPEVSIQRNRYATIENKYIASARLLDVARFHFVRSAQAARQISQNPAFAPLEFIPGSAQYGSIIIGALTPSGLSNVVFGPALASPEKFVQNRFSGQDDVFLTLKSHQIQTGVDISRVQNNSSISAYPAAQYTFPSITTFLAGVPSVAAVFLPGTDAGRSGRELDVSPYIQDDWKVNQQLSLNLGVRYDFVTNPVEAHGKYEAILNYATSTGFTPVPHAFASNPSLKNIDPRIGFSFVPFRSSTKTAIRGGFGIFHDAIAGRTYQGSYNLSPPALFHGVAAPSFPNPLTGGAAGAPSLSSALTYNTTNTPSQIQFSFGVEQQLDHSTVLSVAYVGNLGRHLFGSREVNPVQFQICPCSDPLNPAAALLPPGTQYQPTAGPGHPFVRVNPNFSALNVSQAALNSSYHSLQTKLVRQLSHGLQFQINYVYSKILDYNSLENAQEEFNGAAVVQNQNNIAADYGPAAFDIRHVGTANVLYVFPSRRANPFLSGWEATLLTQLRTGSPYNVIEGFDRAEINDTMIDERPNQVGNPNVAGQVAANPTCTAPTQVHTAAHYYNPCAFVLQPQGTFGNEPRDSLYAAGLQDFDFGLLKNTRIHEDLRLELRAELFNILNHTNLGFPNFTLFTSAAANGVNGLAGSANVTNNTSRQAQFSFKVLF